MHRRGLFNRAADTSAPHPDGAPSPHRAASAEPVARRDGLGSSHLPCGWLVIVALAGCDPTEPVIPLDRAVFPTGLAVTGERLLVVSSDFDLAFEDGALLSADLQEVRSKLDPDVEVTVEGAYAAAALIPPFGDRPVLTSLGERVYVPTRGSNRIAVLDVAADGTLSCGSPLGQQPAPRCGESPFALQLAAADPFDVIITDETRADDGELVRVDGMVTLLSSSEVIFFADDRSLTGAEQMQILGSRELGDLIGGVRSVVLRPEVAGSDRVVIAAADLDRAAGAVGAVLLLFPPSIGATELASFDVTLATGSLAMRDIILVPGEDGDNDALVVALRGPDALARFEIEENGALPTLRLSGVSSTCRAPTSLALARLDAPSAPTGSVDRILLTCQDGDVVEAIDPLSLLTTDSVRFLGRGPYDVVVNAAVTPPEAYVSFFLDGSIGVLQLVDENGLPRLVARGRIGAALPRPEDGRE